MQPTTDPGKTYPHGTYAKVAKRLGVSRQMVRFVALGIHTSGRIRHELDKEWRKAQRKAARQGDTAA